MRGNILVVDDEAGPRESLRMILKWDHDVRTVSNGDDALLEVERDKPDLVFMDLSMPGMHGTELLQAVKARYPEVECAIITAYAAVDSARLAVRCGAVDYLTKPYAVADVLRIVERAMASRRQHQDANVLAEQLAKVTDSLVRQGRDLAPEGDDNNVLVAVEKLQEDSTALDQDLGTMQRLSELGEVTAEVTHDINNLLTVILTNSQYLAMMVENDVSNSKMGEPITTRANRIARAAEDASTIIRRIKDFIRLNINFKPEILDINELINSAVDLKRETPTAADVPATFYVSLEATAPIRGDQVALRTVLINLIENALEAMGKDGVLQVRTTSEAEWVRITLTDNGCGMSAEVLGNATQAFFTNGKDNGTGLGLATADRVIRRHQGTLVIESVEGIGTTLTIDLPIADTEELEVALNQAMSMHETPVNETKSSESSMETVRPTILLVEDEDGIREIMGTVLQVEGYEVVAAVDGLKGLECFHQLLTRKPRPPMMLVTDHEMPGMLGRDLVKHVKAVDESIPAIIVSAYIKSDIGAGYEDLLLQKPFELDDLTAAVKRLLPPTLTLNK